MNMAERHSFLFLGDKDYMTVIGKDRYTDNMLKNRRYKASQCPQCKARTHEEAEKLCRPTQDITGEYTCAGDESCLNPSGVHWDTSGRACELVASDARAEAKALDDWCMAEMEKMEREETYGNSVQRNS